MSDIATLTVAANDRRFSVKLPKGECRDWFNTIVLSICGGIEGIELEEIPPIDASAHSTKTMANPVFREDSLGYRGFLYIECKHCGEIHGFCSKAPLNFYICNDCKKKTDLQALVPMYAKCNCGKSWSYMTNSTSERLSYPCLDCGTPIFLQYRDKTRTYETVQSEQ